MNDGATDFFGGKLMKATTLKHWIPIATLGGFLGATFGGYGCNLGIYPLVI